MNTQAKHDMQVTLRALLEGGDLNTEAMDYAQEWLDALHSWQRTLASKGTRSTYVSAVRLFMQTPGVPPLRYMSAQVIAELAGGMKRAASDEAKPGAPQLAPTTVNVRLRALRNFFDYCRITLQVLPDELNDEALTRALRGMRSHVQRPYEVVAGDEIRRVLEAARHDESYQPARTVALVALALGSGLRVAELCALRLVDLRTDASGHYLDVRRGKGSKQRQVPIAADVYAVVLAYITSTGRSLQRAGDRETFLLLSRKHGDDRQPLSTRQAQRLVDATMRRAGIADSKHISPHALRHSYALGVLAGDPERGIPSAPLPAVSALLGHSSIATTGKYLRHFERADLARYAPSLTQQSADQR